MRVCWRDGVVDDQSVTTLGQEPLDPELQTGPRGGLQVPQTRGALRVRPLQQHGLRGEQRRVAVTVCEERTLQDRRVSEMLGCRSACRISSTQYIQYMLMLKTELCKKFSFS